MKAMAATIVLLAAAGASAGVPSAALVEGPTVHVGKHPAGVALAAGSLWVTNDVDNTVSQVDPRTGAVVKTVKLRGRGFPDPSATAVGGGSLWVAAPTTGTISRIDLRTGLLAATITVPEVVEGIVVGGGALWATSFDPHRCSANRCFSRLTRISTRSNRVTGTFAVDSATGLDAGYGSLWIVNHRAFTVSRFDPRTGRVGATIDVRLPHEGVFDGPNRVAVGLGGVWVSHPVQDVVTRIDPRSNAVVARVRFPRGAEPLGLAVGAGSLWAVGPKEIFRVDPGTNRVVETARVGTHAGNDYRGLRRLAIAGDTLWVTDGDSDTVDRIAVGR